MTFGTSTAPSWTGEHRRAHPRGWYGPPAFVFWVLPAVIALIQVLGTTAAARHQSGARELDALAYALLVAGPAILTRRRRWPVAALVGVAGVTLAYVLVGYPDGPIFLSLIITFVGASIRGHRVAVWAVAAVSYFGFLWGPSIVGTGRSPTLPEIVGIGAWVLVLLAFGELARTGRERGAEAARMRREEMKRQQGEERLRIAQELHDVLAHNISLINVQTGVALHLMDDDPEQARKALTAIKQASNETLQELRSVLDILRPDGAAPRAPTPGLDDLDDLIDRTQGAGLRIRKQVEGSGRAVPANVDRAAYRIVQEALTNVTRHSTADEASVTVTYEPVEVVVVVEDRGRLVTSDAVGGGNGIPGMRERARALGGDLEAGPLEGGGFRVRARLPIEARS